MLIPDTPRVRSCDTVVVAAAASSTGRTLFGKNSDRHPNEAQYLRLVPASRHDAREEQRCTYVSVPGAARRHRVLGSQPWWIWGFEHGINEHGLAIGNEALWSKLPPRTEPGLIGMDLVRLTLERAQSADEALEVLTALIEEFGQSGPTNSVILESYDNGFVLADPERAWLVQSAGHHWAAKRVTTVAAMSNLYTIGTDYTRISEGAVSAAVDAGWYDPETDGPFDFARAFGDEQLPDLDGCARRFERSEHLLETRFERAGTLQLRDVHEVLRDLGEGVPETLRPGPRSEGAICMYAQDPMGSETAASLVAELDPSPERSIIGASAGAPRHAGLIPLWVDLEGLDVWQQPDAETDSDLWWETERLQRQIERAYPAYAPIADAVFDRVNRRFFSTAGSLRGAGRAERLAACRAGAERHRAALRELSHLFRGIGPFIVEPGDADLRGDHLDRLEGMMEETTTARVDEVRARTLADAARDARDAA